MMKYQTLSFSDNAQGHKQMEEAINRYAKDGWEIRSSHTSQQGYNAVKTVALGALFLPAALLGRKGNKIEVILEKKIDEEKEKRLDDFMHSKTSIAIHADGSITCPTCSTKITEYKTRGFIIKTKVFKCPKCGHEILK